MVRTGSHRSNNGNDNDNDEAYEQIERLMRQLYKETNEGITLG